MGRPMGGRPRLVEEGKCFLIPPGAGIVASKNTVKDIVKGELRRELVLFVAGAAVENVLVCGNLTVISILCGYSIGKQE